MADSVDLEKFRRAAAAGHPVAQFNLGLWHLRQAPPGSVPAEARELLLAAAKQDFVPAQTLLGKLLFKLDGAEQRPRHARHWFERAAAAGDAEAQYRLGEVATAGLAGEQDSALGVGWLEQSARQGHTQARVQLAYCLEHGIGRAADAAAATALYLAAARSGDARAQSCVGRRYAEGRTLPRDPAKTLAWQMKAAAQDYPGAALEVARTMAAADETVRREAARMAAGDIPADKPVAAAPHAPREPETLSEAPLVQVCAGFLTPEECDHLVALARPFLAPSKVITNSGQMERRLHERTSEEMAVQEQIKDVVVWNVEQRLADFACLPVEHGEPLMILHYGRGDEYRPHVDYFDPRIQSNAVQLARAGQRIVTVLTYLSDVEDGGATSFPKIGLRVKAEKGKALLFRNSRADGEVEPLTQHAGEPVLAGEKWLATRWIREWDWRRPKPGETKKPDPASP
ncbi:MAG TPA: 2OG-Fe(II) oxygenase [Gammaproteobacteria bacterium]|nr:2OG-Fe(II) oxygenase [Gammaproteobacteria bacterium]